MGTAFLDALVFMASLALAVLLGCALIAERKRQEREDLEWHLEWLDTVRHPSTLVRCWCGAVPLPYGASNYLSGFVLHGRSDCMRLNDYPD